MKPEETELIRQLRDMVDQLKDGQKVSFNPGVIPDSSDAELNRLKSSILSLSNQYNENYSFILDISCGRLDTTPPRKNSFANPYKQLHADLKHLTWQIKQISEGDLNQQVSFSGDFSSAINKMIESLREKNRIAELNVRYLEELKELNATKDRFFSIIAHDLKNPFSGLMGFSEILVNDLKENNLDSALECAEALMTLSDRGYKLLVNLLEWSRSQLNAIKIDIAPISLAFVLEECKILVSERAERKKISITCNGCEGIYVKADENMLKTVIRNLLGNAIKFTSEGGKIILRAGRENGSVFFSVADNGVGISDANIAKLFRIDTNFTTRGTNDEEGTGLGLILCMEFMKKMDGDIYVESQLGKGSTFTIKLPGADI